MLTTENYHGTALEPAEQAEDAVEQVVATKVMRQFKSRRHLRHALGAPNGYRMEPDAPRPMLALFCFENATSAVGEFASRLAEALAEREVAVHLFARQGFELANVSVHCVGASTGEDLIEQAQEFARRAANAFLRLFQAEEAPITLLGCEWSSIPVLTILQGVKNLDILWSVHSLEAQRSDMSSDMSKRIDEIELTGLRAAKAVLIHDPATALEAKRRAPECSERIVNERQVFPVAHFHDPIDPGQVKARYQVGPIDPTILFVGDLSERYGPDLLVKAMPAILKNHPQARLVIVGAGQLYWPLRVYTRYLLLEHAVRLVGNVEGQALRELIQAADVIAVPSRETTPWWPFLAGWAAHRPVVATHEAAPGVLSNEENSILCYPSENSCVWGIERILYDAALGSALAQKGHDTLQDRFGWKNVALQVEGMLGVASATAAGAPVAGALVAGAPIAH